MNKNPTGKKDRKGKTPAAVAILLRTLLLTAFLTLLPPASPFGALSAMASQTDGDTGQDEGAGQDEDAGQNVETGFEDTNLARLSSVVALNQYPLLDALPEGEDPDDYILLLKDTGSYYTVEKGDYLWKLSRDFYGRGAYWESLYNANREELCGGSVLHPGRKLLVPDKAYIRRQKDSLGGYVDVGAYSADYPNVMYYGYLEYDACLNSFFSKNVDAHILWHVTQLKSDADDLSGDWPRACKKIEAAGREICGDGLSDLSFENYTLGDGSGLYCFSFTCRDSDGLKDYMVCYRTGKRYTAEFIGYTLRSEAGPIWNTDVRIGDLTRYIAASFCDMGGDAHGAQLKYKRYLGAESWPWESLHNPFAIAARKFESAPAPLDVEDYEITWAEPQIESFVRSLLVWHYDPDDEEFDAFMARKIKAGELNWITEFTCKESFLDERDDITVNESSNGLSYQDPLKPLEDHTLSDLKHFRNLKKVTLGIGSVSDYSVLGELPKLQSIDIQAGSTVKDISFVRKLPHLRELTLTKSSMQHLADRGFSMDTFQESYSGRPGLGFNEVADWSPLASCPELSSLCLSVDSLDSLDLLDDLPNLYSLRLSAPDDTGDAVIGLNAKDRDALLSEDAYPHIKCLVLDSEWLRNPE